MNESSNDCVLEPIVMLWPSKGFIGYCRWQISKGLMFRYWITLPAMYRREMAWRRELTETLNEHNTSSNGDRPEKI